MARQEHDLDFVAVDREAEQLEMTDVEILYELADIALARKRTAAQRNFDLPDLARIAAFDRIVDRYVAVTCRRARLRLFPQSREDRIGAPAIEVGCAHEMRCAASEAAPT